MVRGIKKNTASIKQEEKACKITEGEDLEADHEGGLGAGEWVWVEGGAPAGSRREGVLEGRCIHEGASAEEVHACHAEALGPGDPWEIQMEALGGACPLEEVQDVAFRVVVEVAVAPQSLEVLHGGVLSHEGHGGPAASETFLDGAFRPEGTDEDGNVHVQGVRLLGFQLMGGHVLQPQEALVVAAWPGVSQVEGLQEGALEAERSQEEAYLVEEAQIPVMTPQDWGQKGEGEHLQTAGGADQLGRVGSELPEVAQPLSHGVHPWSPS